jgi:outer membrane immunogenic protein
MNLGAFSPFCRVCGPEGTTVNLNDNSAFVGGHIGYALQAGNLVIGPELGVQYWGMKKSAQLLPATVETPAVLLQTRIDWLAYANVRAGFLVSPSFLVYLTGGPAWAHIKGDVPGISGAINLTNIADTSNNQSIFGLNVGGGLAYKLSEYVILSGEYRHYDFGKVSAANPVFNLMGIGNSDRLTVDQAMARLSYRLN